MQRKLVQEQQQNSVGSLRGGFTNNSPKVFPKLKPNQQEEKKRL
jgi:hypothetical protein